MEEKKYRMLTLQTVILSVICAVVVISAVVLGTKMIKLEKSINMVTEKIETLDIQKLEESAVSLKGAADNLSDVDINGINELVNSLNTVSSALEKAAGAIGGLFGR